MLHASKCIPYAGILRNQSFRSPVSKTFQDHLLCLPIYFFQACGHLADDVGIFQD